MESRQSDSTSLSAVWLARNRSCSEVIQKPSEGARSSVGGCIHRSTPTIPGKPISLIRAQHNRLPQAGIGGVGEFAVYGECLLTELTVTDSVMKPKI